MAWLKVSTAVTVPFGPFVSVGNGKTPMTAMVISKPAVLISKNNGVFASKAAANNAAGGTNGWYRISFSVTDLNTVGPFIVHINHASALPVWARYDVVKSTAYSALNGLDGWGLKANAVSATKIAPNALSAAKFATNAITGRVIAANAVSATKIAPFSITESKIATNAIDNRVIAATGINKIVTAINAVTVDGSTKIVNSQFNNAVVDGGSFTGTKVGMIDTFTFAPPSDPTAP